MYQVLEAVAGVSGRARRRRLTLGVDAARHGDPTLWPAGEVAEAAAWVREGAAAAERVPSTRAFAHIVDVAVVSRRVEAWLLDRALWCLLAADRGRAVEILRAHDARCRRADPSAYAAAQQRTRDDWRASGRCGERAFQVAFEHVLPAWRAAHAATLAAYRAGVLDPVTPWPDAGDPWLDTAHPAAAWPPRVRRGYVAVDALDAEAWPTAALVACAHAVLASGTQRHLAAARRAISPADPASVALALEVAMGGFGAAGGLASRTLAVGPTAAAAAAARAQHAVACARAAGVDFALGPARALCYATGAVVPCSRGGGGVAPSGVEEPGWCGKRLARAWRDAGAPATKRSRREGVTQSCRDGGGAAQGAVRLVLRARSVRGLQDVARALDAVDPAALALAVEDCAPPCVAAVVRRAMAQEGHPKDAARQLLKYTFAAAGWPLELADGVVAACQERCGVAPAARGACGDAYARAGTVEGAAVRQADSAPGHAAGEGEEKAGAGLVVVHARDDPFPSAYVGLACKTVHRQTPSLCPFMAAGSGVDTLRHAADVPRGSSEDVGWVGAYASACVPGAPLDALRTLARGACARCLTPRLEAWEHAPRAVALPRQWIVRELAGGEVG